MTDAAEQRTEPTPFTPLRLETVRGTSVVTPGLRPVTGGPDVAMMLSPNNYDCDAWAKFFAAAPDTAAERDRLQVANAELRDALIILLFSAVSQAHGRQAAQNLKDNNWVWPDDAPRLVNIGHEEARAVLASAKESTS